MNNLVIEITKDLLEQKSVALVGATDSGKTYWIKSKLIPHIQSLGKNVEYLENGDKLPSEASDIVICDEAETFSDKEYVQERNENQYSPEYEKKVLDIWHKNYSKLPASTLFVITRNTPKQIDNLSQNFKTADWDNREIVVVKFVP
jgi:hypothetical protein